MQQLATYNAIVAGSSTLVTAGLLERSEKCHETVKKQVYTMMHLITISYLNSEFIPPQQEEKIKVLQETIEMSFNLDDGPRIINKILQSCLKSLVAHVPPTVLREIMYTRFSSGISIPYENAHQLNLHCIYSLPMWELFAVGY